MTSRRESSQDRLTDARSAEQSLSAYLADPANERKFLEAQVRLHLSLIMRSFREAAGLRQEDLARRIGCSQSYVAKLEGGAYGSIGLDLLSTYARALGRDVDVSALFVKPGEHVGSEPERVTREGAEPVTLQGAGLELERFEKAYPSIMRSFETDADLDDFGAAA